MKQISNIKLRAGALQYTIFIAVVIALLVFAFISLSYTEQRFKIKAENFSQVIARTNLAIDYAQHTQLPYSEVVNIPFSDIQLHNTTIQKKAWGIFDIVTATSSIKNETFTKNAFLGGFLKNRTSLYLQDDNQPLVLVGDTRIEGSAALPKQGVKRGTIAGNSYTGSQLIYGNTSLSKTVLPKLKNKAYLKQLTQGAIELENYTSVTLNENIRLLNSFNESTRVFFSDSSIDLSNIELIGNIIVRSSTKIRIHKSAQLTDVLLIAPAIEISDAVNGNFQAFATTNIVVGKNCTLKYPSAFIVYEKNVNTAINQNNRNEDFNRIEIQSGSKISGIVGFLSDSDINNYKPQILIETNAFVTGEVYSAQSVELKGTVLGSLFTKGFIANQFGSIYQNHIYNGKILTTDFPEQYSGLAIENESTTIAKWLY